MAELSVRELQRLTGETNIANGWRESALAEPGTKERVHQDIVELALIITEASEAIEEIRGGKPDLYYSSKVNGKVEEYYADEVEAFEGLLFKPEGVRSEVADVVIRALDFADKRGFDLYSDVAEKLAFNVTRGYRHGGKKA